MDLERLPSPEEYYEEVMNNHRERKVKAVGPFVGDKGPFFGVQFYDGLVVDYKNFHTYFVKTPPDQYSS